MHILSDLELRAIGVTYDRGLFSYHLAKAFLHADEDARAKILAAFPDSLPAARPIEENPISSI